MGLSAFEAVGVRGKTGPPPWHHVAGAPGAAPASTYIPTTNELDFRTGNVQTIDIRPTGTATRDLTSGQLQNVTINVSTINPTQEVGEAVVTAIRNYNRTSGSAQFGVTRL